MQTRIRYIKNGDTLVTSRPILCGVNLYEIVISINNTEARIQEIGGDRLFIAKATTLAGLKKYIKNVLQGLGATFAQEIRNRGETRKL